MSKDWLEAWMWFAVIAFSVLVAVGLVKAQRECEAHGGTWQHVFKATYKCVGAKK